MAFLIAYTAMARVVRPEFRLYFVSPTLTMPVLQVSDDRGVYPGCTWIGLSALAAAFRSPLTVPWSAA